MIAALVAIIVGIVGFVLYDIARTTAACARAGLRGEERAQLADQPTAEEVGQRTREREH